MSILSSLNPTEFEKSLNPQILILGMIVLGSLVFGPSIFLIVSLFALQGVSPIQPNAEITSFYTIMIIVLSVFAITAAAAGIFLYNIQFSSKKLESVLSSESVNQASTSVTLSPYEKLIIHIRNAMIIRAALFEAAAFFGLVIILLAAQQGVLYTLEFIWLATVPYVILIIMVAMTFPTKERMIQIFREKIVY